jgi:hypothetical protein
VRIDRRLNLVIPIDRDDGLTDYVHSTPISREIFEKYFLVLSKAYAEIYGGGLGVIAGPRVAALLVKKFAAEMGGQYEKEVTDGLIPEIHRLTNVIVAGVGMVPYQQALDQKRVSDDDAAEVENALVFFTVASHMHKQQDRTGILQGAASLWGAQTTLSNCTEYAASLRTSTPPASIGGSKP